MMLDSDKKNFWLLINTCMELTNHPKLSKEAIVVWWHILSKYDYDVVETAIDKWCKTMSKPPMPNDILNLCKPAVTIFARLPSPLAKAENKRHADEVVAFVANNIKPVQDKKQWARDLVSGKKVSNWYKAVDFAKEALNAK